MTTKWRKVLIISEKNRKIIGRYSIFDNMTDEQIDEALEVFSCFEKKFRKGEYVYSVGETTDFMGIVMKGSLIVERNDYWGRKTILMKKHPGESVAISFAQLENSPFTVDVVSERDSEVFFMKIGSYDRIATEKKDWYGTISRNLMTLANTSTLESLRRSYYVIPRKIRERVFAYLNTQAINNRSLSFDIPFNRQQMAEYLNVDRSALSKELSLMREAGYIDFHKNHFTVLVDPDGLEDARKRGIFND